jgi:hypothetical protein
VFFLDRPDSVPQAQPADDAPDREEDQRERNG